MKVAFVHPWKAPGSFGLLIFASGAGFIVSAILHNVFHGVAPMVGESGIAHDALAGAGAAFFLIAIFLCPSGFLVGFVGAAIMRGRENRSSSGDPAA